MKLKKSMGTAMLSAALGLAMTGQAMAGVYAGSANTFDNLTVSISPFAGATINNFSFTSTNTAQLNNGAIAVTGGTCNGTTTPAVNNCGVLGSTAILAGDVLSFGAANAAGSTVARGNNDYTTTFGPDGQQYANSNSRIEDSELTEGIPTKTQQIAEAEIQNVNSASASAELSSLTSFTFTFTLAAPGMLTLSFDASKYLLADINDATATTADARASIETRFSLQQSGGAQFWQWTPGVNCVAAGGVTCANLTEPYNLGSDTASASAVPTDTDNRTAGLASFSADATGLLAGTYSLTLFTKTSVVVGRREAAVPEPATLFLVGAGLAGIGFGRRYRKS